MSMHNKEDFNYYIVYGRQKPKRIPKDGVDFFLGSKFDIDNDPKIQKIFKIPSKFTADQARFLISKENPQYVNVLYDKKGSVKHMQLSRSDKIEQIKKQYDPSIHFIQVYDDRGNEYNYKYGRTLAKRTGCGTESIENYDIEKIPNPIVRVFGRGETQGSCVMKGRKYMEEKL